MTPETAAKSLPQWDIALLRAAAARGLRQTPADDGTRVAPSPSDFDLIPGFDTPPLQSLTPAAVLVPVVMREPLTLLLTERTAHLPAHAGQIAFPGGKIESGETALEAALRESQEEIGLAGSLVEPIGFLDTYRTGTGFKITPVVGLIAPEFTLHINQNEVASVFEVPLAFLLDQANHRIDSREWRGAQRQYYAMPYNDRYIWGATAGIIRILQRSLAAP